MFPDLCNALDAIATSVSAGEDFDAAAADELMAKIQRAVPMLEREEVVLLQAKLHATMDQVAKAQTQVTKTLGEIQGGRRGLKGYDHIKGHKTQQRLYRQA